jgi:hypothetical protein
MQHCSRGFSTGNDCVFPRNDSSRGLRSRGNEKVARNIALTDVFAKSDFNWIERNFGHYIRSKFCRWVEAFATALTPRHG